MTAICTCGYTTLCPGTCAGALLQRQICKEQGHLAGEALLKPLRTGPSVLLPGEFCYRCGEEG